MQNTDAKSGGRSWFGLLVAAGLVLLIGLLVWAVWFLGNQLLGGFIGADQPSVAVPSLTGMELEQARSEIREVGLELVVGERVPSSEYGEGMVVSQDPPAHRTVAEGREVRVSVSGGSLVVSVPDVTGREFEEAQQALIDSRLIIGDVQRVLRPEGERGTVLWQNPSPDERVSVRTPVDLLLVETDTTQTVEVPDVQGMKLRGAEVLLRENGTVLRRVDYVLSGATAGTVVAQSPPPGETVKRGGAVELEVATPEEIYTERIREFLVQLGVPRGPSQQKVELIVDDTRGQNTVYTEFHSPGDRIERKVTLHGSGEVEIRIDDRLFRRDVMGYRPPPEGSDEEESEYTFPSIQGD